MVRQITPFFLPSFIYFVVVHFAVLLVCHKVDYDPLITRQRASTHLTRGRYAVQM